MGSIYNRQMVVHVSNIKLFLRALFVICTVTFFSPGILCHHWNGWLWLLTAHCEYSSALPVKIMIDHNPIRLTLFEGFSKANK